MSHRPCALVVDDDVAIRVLVCRILTRSGFEVDAVRDGAEAIEHILQHRYAAIVLDLMMPRVDGFQVVEYLKINHPELLKRVIVMTAFGATGIERVAPLVSCCVEKPFEVSSLAQKAKALAALDSPDRPEPAKRSDEAKTDTAVPPVSVNAGERVWRPGLTPLPAPQSARREDDGEGRDTTWAVGRNTVAGVAGKQERPPRGWP